MDYLNRYSKMRIISLFTNAIVGAIRLLKEEFKQPIYYSTYYFWALYLGIKNKNVIYPINYNETDMDIKTYFNVDNWIGIDYLSI